MGSSSDQSMVKEDLLEITKGTGIIFLGKGMNVILRYAFNLIIARQIGAELMGLYFLAMVIIEFTKTFTLAGLRSGVIRFVAMYQGLNDSRRVKGILIFSLRIVLVTSIFFMISLYFGANFLSYNVFKKVELAEILRLLVIILPFSCLSTIFIAFIQAFRQLKYKVYIESLLIPASRLTMALILIYWGWSLLGVIIACISSEILGMVSSFYFSKKIFPFIKRRLTPYYESKNLLKFSLPLVLAAFLDLTLLRTDTLMLGFYQGPQDIGIYNIALRMAMLINIILTSFFPIFLPMIANLYNQKEFERLGYLFKVITKWIFTLSFPIFLLISLFSKEILSIFGDEFIQGSSCLIILGIAYLADAGAGPVGNMLLMTGRQYLTLINTLGTCLLNIFLNFLLIPYYGILGAAIASGSSLIFFNIIKLTQVAYILKMHPYRLNFIKPISAGIGAGLFTFWALKTINLTFSLFPLFVIIYVVLLFLFKFDQEDYIVLNKLREKLYPKRLVVTL
jgi:O-antigen/teichoic acid export membrane protein